MVGIFSRFSDYMLRTQQQKDEKEGLLNEEEGVGDDEISSNVVVELNMEEINGDGNGVIVYDDDDDDGEFKPIMHPLEPPDDDRPVKCPLPDCYLVNDGGQLKESFRESLRKRTGITIGEVSERSPAQAERKRRQTGTRETAATAFRSPQYNFLQVFQQCKQLET